MRLKVKGAECGGLKAPRRAIRNLGAAWAASRRSTDRAFGGGFVGILFQPFVFLCGAVLLAASPVLDRLPIRRLLIFNLTALGHNIMEFITYWASLPGSEEAAATTVLYFARRKPPVTNEFIFEIWKRLGSTKNVELVRVSPFSWSVLSWIALSSGRANPWLRGLHPDFSRYTSLPRNEVRSLFTEVETQKLREALDRYLPEAAGAYCVVGIRDGAYYSDLSNRNSGVADYLPTLQLLLDRGFYVVRMGRPVLEPLPLSHPALFDYSTSEVVSDEMDVLLWAHADFAIGDSSGLTDAVALFGSRVFCPTYPLDPRAFLSHPSYSFATQRLRTISSGHDLGLQQVIELMNRGLNLGDERVLASLGLRAERPSPAEMRGSVAWFLDSVLAGDSVSLDAAHVSQAIMLDVLTKDDEDAWRHYRRDALYRESWRSMESLMYPESVQRLLGM
jgi:putative glycosyltransferase (TIGR04372 family)